MADDGGRAGMNEEPSAKTFFTSFRNAIESGLARTNRYVAVVDRNLRFLYASPPLASLLNTGADRLIGRSYEELGLPSSVKVIGMERFRQALEDGQTHRGEVSFEVNGHTSYWEIDAVPILDDDDQPVAVIGFIHDRTEETRYRRLLEILHRVNIELSSGPEVRDLIPRAIDIISGALDEDGFALAVRHQGRWISRQSLPLTPAEAEELGTQAFLLASEVIKSGEAINLADAAEDERVDREIVKKFGIRALLLTPLRTKGEVAGALIFARKEPRPFSPGEVHLAEMLSTSVSVAFSKQLIIDELSAASTKKGVLNASISQERDLVRGILEASPMSIVLMEGPKLIATMCNRSYREHTWAFKGMEHEGVSFLEHFDHEEGERLMALVEIVISSKQPLVGVSHTRRYPNGRLRHVQLSLMPLSFEPLRVLGVTADVTDLVEARERIERMAQDAERERKRLRAILDTLPVGVLIVDAEGNTIEANKNRESIWGGKLPTLKYPEGTKFFKGRWADTGVPLNRNDWPLVQAMKGDTVVDAVIDITRIDGKLATVLSLAAPILGEQGKVVGAVSVFLDITSQRSLEHEALDAKERAEMYLELLTKDIAGYNGMIIEGISRIRDGKGYKDKRDELDRALAAARTSTELVETVRKIKAVESNEPSYSHLDLGMVIDDAIGQFRNVQEAKIEAVIVPNRLVNGNVLLRDVFDNIIGNAIKHAGREVTIKVIMTKSFDAGREYHKVIIEDDGPGIPDEIKSRIFLRKYRGPTKSSGTGLGLYLVKQVVEDLNGRVWVEDRIPGDYTKGAKFIVILPAVTEPSVRASGGQDVIKS